MRVRCFARRPAARRRGRAAGGRRASDAKKQVEFGITRRAAGTVARGDLPVGARHADRSDLRRRRYNNLAIALRARRRSREGARRRMKRRWSSSPNNAYIKQNYELFKEINDRTTRRTVV